MMSSSLAALGHAPRGGCRQRPVGYFDLKKPSPGVTTAYWGRRWLLACRRSFESDQTCSSKVTTPGDSPFEIRWL